jgi:hypothetical protein
MLAALVTLFMTGLFITGLGTAMAWPGLWDEYRYLVVPFLALLGIISAALCFIQGNQPQTEDTLLKRIIERGLRFMDILQHTQLSSVNKLFGKNSIIHGMSPQRHSKIHSAQWLKFIDVIEDQIRCWPVISTILALLLLALIFLVSFTV